MGEQRRAGGQGNSRKVVASIDLTYSSYLKIVLDLKKVEGGYRTQKNWGTKKWKMSGDQKGQGEEEAAPS